MRRTSTELAQDLKHSKTGLTEDPYFTDPGLKINTPRMPSRHLPGPLPPRRCHRGTPLAASPEKPWVAGFRGARLPET